MYRQDCLWNTWVIWLYLHCRHENASGYYRVSAYFIAKVLTDLIPARIVPLLVYCTVAYFMIGKCCALPQLKCAHFVHFWWRLGRGRETFLHFLAHCVLGIYCILINSLCYQCWDQCHRHSHSVYWLGLCDVHGIMDHVILCKLLHMYWSVSIYSYLGDSWLLSTPCQNGCSG